VHLFLLYCLSPTQPHLHHISLAAARYVPAPACRTPWRTTLRTRRRTMASLTSAYVPLMTTTPAEQHTDSHSTTAETRTRSAARCSTRIPRAPTPTRSTASPTTAHTRPTACPRHMPPTGRHSTPARPTTAPTSTRRRAATTQRATLAHRNGRPRRMRGARPARPLHGESASSPAAPLLPPAASSAA
jgi:hypothetical protein